MGNIRKWGGPVSSTLLRMQMILQKKIINRQRMFGMKVAVPAFPGYLPWAMKRIFPNSSFATVASWNNFPVEFCCSLFISPFEPLYREIAVKFLRKVIHNYGTDHIYFTDPFNEMQPPSSESAYIRKVSFHLFNAMLNVDERSVWLLQGWMFIKDEFWTPELTKAFLTAVPKGRLLVLDLQSEQYPLYKKTSSFYGQPFIWCMLHNFGGTLGMHGSAEAVNVGIRQASLMKNSSMVGVGLTPEGINQNYVMYALLLERAWQSEEMNLIEWFNKFSDVRYGVIKYKLREAWGLLKNSVYSYQGAKRIHGKYIFTRRPSTRLEVSIWYNVSNVLNAWSNLLECNKLISKYVYDDYRHDLVDITRQYLQIQFELLYTELMVAFKNRSIGHFQNIAGQMLQVLEDLEEILATHENFLLGTWLRDAKSWATNSAEDGLLEFNARNQITLWGPTGEIADYATKQWSGIVKDFYQPRWKLFLESLYKCLKSGVPFNNSNFKKAVLVQIEVPFNYQQKIYPIHGKQSTYDVSHSIYLKYVSSD